MKKILSIVALLSVGTTLVDAMTPEQTEQNRLIVLGKLRQIYERRETTASQSRDLNDAQGTDDALSGEEQEVDEDQSLDELVENNG